MTIIKFRNWELIVDKQLTKQTYDKATLGSADVCICNECKNFSNQRDAAFPIEIKQLFADIGIDYKKESEICRYCKLDNGLHYYGGWFHFKGQFIGKNCSIVTEKGDGYSLDLTPITDTFNLGFRIDSALTFFDEKTNLVQIEFETKIPWIIDRELENE